MHDHASDARRLLETDVCPRRAGVGGLVDARAPRRRLAIVLLARPRIDDLRIRRSDGEIAESILRHRVEDREPERASIRGLPDPARGRGYIYGCGVGWVDLDVMDAP